MPQIFIVVFMFVECAYGSSAARVLLRDREEEMERVKL